MKKRRRSQRIALLLVIAILLSLFVAIAMVMTMSGCSPVQNISGMTRTDPAPVSSSASEASPPAKETEASSPSFSSPPLSKTLNRQEITIPIISKTPTSTAATRTATSKKTTRVPEPKTLKTTTSAKSSSKAPVLKTPGAVAITFDDGPGPHTGRLLDALQAYGIKATFFLVGQSVAPNSSLVLRMQEEGHQIGNHTWSHPDLVKTDSAARRKQIRRTSEAIEKITGEKPSIMRPPYGTRSQAVFNDVKKEGLAAVFWHDGPSDWKYPDDVNYVCDYLLSHVDKGEIIILHDTLPWAIDGFLKALPVLLERGFTFVTVDQLVQLQPGDVYPRFWR